MPLIKDGQPATDDPVVQWRTSERCHRKAPIIVGWRAGRRSGVDRARNTPIGLRLKPNDAVEQIAGDLDRFAVIALEFPKFTDGRAMSQARLLRERHGYRGEIRAIGKVLRDLLLFMHRCGFDAFEVADNVTAGIIAKSLSEFDVFYQPAADGSRSVIQQRYEKSAAPAPRPHACCQN